MIINFWNWLIQSIQSALNILGTMISNTELAPFWEMFIVVFVIGCLMHFVIKPLIGFSGSSDKVKKKKEEE